MDAMRVGRGLSAGLVFLLLLGGGPSCAQFHGRGAEVRVVSPVQIVSEPSRMHTISIEVTNRTNRQERFREDVILPKGWSMVIPMTSFVLPPQASTARLLSFQIPINAAEGRAKIQYSVQSDRDPSIRGSMEYEVVVLAVAKTDLMVENPPASLMAGEEYEFSARLVNSGNIPRTFLIRAKNTDPNSPALAAPSEVSLKPGEGAAISVSGKIDPGFRGTVTVIQLTAEIEKDGKKEEAVSTAVLLEVVPALFKKPEPYHILPSTFAVSAARTAGGDTKPSFEWKGAGTLDEEGEQQFSFSFRGPDVDDSSFFSRTDEYWMNYSSRSLGILMGDQPYGVSPLTVFSSYGRGFGVDFKSMAGGNMSAGLFYVRDRAGEEDWIDRGFYLQRSLGDDSFLRLNVAQSETKATSSEPEVEDKLWSLEGRFRTGKNSTLEVEYGHSSTDRPGAKNDDDAYRFLWRGMTAGKMSYSLGKTHAGADYWGYFHSYDYENASVSLPVGPKMRLGIGASSYENNLDRRQGESDTAVSENLVQATLDFSLQNGWFLMVGFDDFGRVDRLAPANFDYSETSYWIRFGRNFGQINWSVEPRFSDQHNHLTGVSESAWNVNFLVSYFPSPNLTLSFFWNLGDNDVLSESYLLRGSSSFGGAVFWRASPRLTLSLAYTRSGIGDNAEMLSNQFDLIATYEMTEERLLTLEVTRDDYETEYRLSYQIPVGIKTVKKTNVGILRGKVFDSMNPEKPGLPDIVVRVGTEAVVTDKDGLFLFPALEPGFYRVMIDPKSIGYGFTTVQKYPISLEIAGGPKPVSMDIGITKGAIFRGRLALREGGTGDGGKEGAGGPPATESGAKPVSLAHILVELTRDDQTVRRSTDMNGEFVFDNIRPGNWQLTFYEAGIPAGYQFETESKTIDLAPGDVMEMVNHIFRKKRTIQFIDSGTVTTTSSSGKKK